MVLEILMEGIFVIGGWNLKRSDFDNSRLKTFFCEYLTSIKIKITMVCVYKEFQIQKKMVQGKIIQINVKFLLEGIVGERR